MKNYPACRDKELLYTEAAVGMGCPRFLRYSIQMAFLDHLN